MPPNAMQRSHSRKTTVAASCLLAATSIERGRRDSNPQPPDRQSASCLHFRPILAFPLDLAGIRDLTHNDVESNGIQLVWVFHLVQYPRTSTDGERIGKQAICDSDRRTGLVAVAERGPRQSGKDFSAQRSCFAGCGHGRGRCIMAGQLPLGWAGKPKDVRHALFDAIASRERTAV